MSFEGADGLRREGMPIAHADGHAGVEVRAEGLLQGLRLAPGELQDRALAADLGIVMGHVFGPARGDQARQRLPRDAGEGKIDDIRIAKKVVQKRLNGFE